MRLGAVALCLSVSACSFSAPGAGSSDARSTDALPFDSGMGSEPTTPGVDAADLDAPAIDATPVVDAAPITPDAPPQFCAGTGLATVCFPTAPTADFTATGTSGVFDSDTNCTITQVVQGRTVCVIARHDVTVPMDTFVRGVGSRPIILFASGNVVIAGQISVANRPDLGVVGAGAASANCTAMQGEDNTNGGGGGAGAGFSDLGGAGGSGDDNNGSGGGAGAALAVEIHAGCTGGRGGNGNASGGAGGQGGGAIYIIAGGSITVTTTGLITAPGAGGEGGHAEANFSDHSGGGGGGGAGGFIGFDAPTVAIAGQLYATGGGGGEGASFNRNDGEAGSAGSLTTTGRAPGGTQGTQSGGNGGTGSGGGGASARRGETGDSSSYGGGGGGGAAGYIYVHGTTLDVASARVSPLISN